MARPRRQTYVPEVQVIIVADDNIPYVRQVFSALGQVRTVRGRSLSPEQVADAELLLTRSTVKVNEALLAGSRVRFVATATVGTDHVDTAYLQSRGIAFASAAGSNANSVAEYVMAALLALAQRHGWQLAGRSIGVIGVGNVGSRVVAKARALGMRPVQNDPPLARSTGDPRYRPLEEALDCDIVTLHVPLTREGPDATWHMADGRFFAAMRPGAVFVNSSRGAVVAQQDLKAAIRAGRLGAVVLDVWEGEPEVDTELLSMVQIGTPHIAGHSLDGKAAGTQMVYEAACRFLGVEPTEDVRRYLPPPSVPSLTVRGPGEAQDIVARTVARVYDVTADDARMRGLLRVPEGQRAGLFDRLRRERPDRREFYNTELRFVDCPEQARQALLGLGFRQAQEAP